MAKLYINPYEYVQIGRQDPVNYLLREIALRPSFGNLSRLNLILPNPDPILRKLGKNISTYRDLLSDAHVFSNVQRRKSGVLSMEWEIDRGKSKSRVARYITDLFNSDEFDIYQVLSEILDAPFYGYQPLEVMWHLEPVRVIGKPPEWFIFDYENQLKYRPANGPAAGIDLPDKKFLLARHHATYQNPYGEAVLARCFWPITFKKGGFKFFVIFTEKWGMPFIVGKHRRGENEQEINKLADMLENMIQDAIAVIPEDAQVEIIERQGTANGEIYTGLMHFCNFEVSKAILGHSASSDATPGRLGNENLAERAGDDIIWADKRLLEKTLNQFIAWAAEIKFGEISNPPHFSLYEEEEVDKDLALRDETLSRTGIKFTKKYFQRAYGLEEDEFEVPPALPGGWPGGDFADAAAAAPDGGQKRIDELLDNLSETELQRQIEETLQPVLSAINSGSNYNEMLEQLAGLYPAMDTEKLQDLLGRIIFISETWGRLTGKENG